MTVYFETKKKEITHSIEEYLEYATNINAGVKPWGEDILSRIKQYSLQGKMLRGALVCLGHDLYGGNNTVASLAGAVAMELFQSGLLIHDDIMDRDEMRRGAPSLHYQYAKIFEAEGQGNFYHQGESFGVCGGDISFFLAYDCLARAKVPVGAISLCARELVSVCLGQMNDVYFGASKTHQVTKEEVISLYEMKTGRYTFSLPLMLGAALAGTPETKYAELSRLGGIMGVIFQVRDDELGVFGESSKIGKPTGTDIREGKQTLFYLELKKRLNSAEWVKAKSIFGNKNCSFNDIQWIREQMEKCGARDEVLSMTDRLINEAARMIDCLFGNEFHKAELLGILHYISTREK